MSTNTITAQMSGPDDPDEPYGQFGPALPGPDGPSGLEMYPSPGPVTSPNTGNPYTVNPYTGGGYPGGPDIGGPSGGAYLGPLADRPVGPGGGSFIGPIAGAPAPRGAEATVALPEPLQWLLEVVVGERWPAAVESDVHAVADVWRHLGGQVTEAHQAAEPAAGAVTQYNRGPGVEAFGRFWRRFSTQPLPKAVSVCGELEGMLREFAGDVAGTKTYIIVQLEILAGEVALGLAGSEITLGVSDAVASAAAAATRALIRDALGELATKTAATAARMAAKASATELLNDGTLQTLQQLNGGHTFNLGQWAHAGALGAVGGLAGGPVGERVTELGRPSVVHAALANGAEQLAENSAKQLADAATSASATDPSETVSLVARGAVHGAVAHHAHSSHPREFLPTSPPHTTHTVTTASGAGSDGAPGGQVPAARSGVEPPQAAPAAAPRPPAARPPASQPPTPRTPAYEPGLITRALAGED